MALLHGRMLLLRLSLAAVVLLSATTLMLAAAQAPPAGCNESCGGVSIPYPFGLTDGCYLHVPGQDSQQFKLACDTANSSQPTLNFLDSYNYATTIPNIFVGESALQVMMTAARTCYINGTYDRSLDKVITLYLPPSYTLSDVRNKVYNIGCNKVTKVIAYPLKVTDPEQPFEVRFSGVSLCQDAFGKRFPETCTGFGCSVNSIPSGMQNITVDVWTVGTSLGETEQWGLSYPCSYGFVVDERNFTFAGNQSFVDLNSTREELPVLVNWAIGNDNCEAAKRKNEAVFACKGINTKCVNRADGYFCQCEDGYQGNPYLLDNCLDIDECQNTTLCSGPATCINSVGDYTCKCHDGFRNDDNDKNKCVPNTGGSNKNVKVMKISLGVCLSFLVVVSITFWTCHLCRKSKFKKLATKFTEINGGFLLQEELKKNKGSKKPRIFTLEELKKATNNFHATQVIGEGTYGKVYKGTLPADNMVVAIKKSKSVAPTVFSQNQAQFVYELLVLSGINHKNFVTVIGCCLEDKTPMLVYEFVGKGKLDEHIHKSSGKGPLPFGQRMKIAADIAGSLANLHHHDSIQIQYRDVSCRLSHPKTSNILLGENFTAKVSDFTATKLLPSNPNTTAWQETLVYMDPEFEHDEPHKLTEKSDVYSYGVVLVELLTSRPVAVFNKTEAERNLAKFFLKFLGDKHLDQILDHEIIKEEESFEIAEQVAQLAKRCLSLKGADRPTMRDVETELSAILTKHPGVMPDSAHTETHHLLAASPSNAYTVDVRSDASIYSMESQAQMMKPFEGGR